MQLQLTWDNVSMMGFLGTILLWLTGDNVTVADYDNATMADFGQCNYGGLSRYNLTMDY